MNIPDRSTELNNDTPSSQRMRVVNALNGHSGPMPVLLHGWGAWKLTVAGLPDRLLYTLGGERFAAVELELYRRFGCDWVHTGCGDRPNLWNCSYRWDGDRFIVTDASGAAYVVDESYEIRPLLPTEVPVPSSSAPRGFSFESEQEVDDFFATLPPPNERFLHAKYEHIRILRERHGFTGFIAVNEGSPGFGAAEEGLSWEELLVSVLERPQIAARCALRARERFLHSVRAARACGADAFIVSECLGFACDTVSPALFQEVLGEPLDFFYRAVRACGLFSIAYMLGDINPLIPFINTLPINGLMIEEGKKGFSLDPVVLRERLRTDLCLFGNTDSALLLNGPPDAIAREARRQALAARSGPFAACTGSPLAVHTPAEHVQVFLDASREARAAA